MQSSSYPLTARAGSAGRSAIRPRKGPGYVPNIHPKISRAVVRIRREQGPVAALRWLLALRVFPPSARLLVNFLSPTL